MAMEVEEMEIVIQNNWRGTRLKQFEVILLQQHMPEYQYLNIPYLQFKIWLFSWIPIIIEMYLKHKDKEVSAVMMCWYIIVLWGWFGLDRV